MTAVAVAVLLLAGCGGGDEQEEPEPDVPAGFDVPEGVTLTEPDTALDVGASGTVVIDLGGGAASATTVEVSEVIKGRMRDFRFFSLDEQTKKSTPYYVQAAVTNEGPAGLGGVSLPLLAHTDADTLYPASELVGEFEKCPDPTIPENFLPGESADVCLIFLVPEGEGLETIDLQPGEPADAVRWQP